MNLLKYWRLALTEVYTLNFIDEKTFIRMYEYNFFNSISSNIEDKKQIVLVMDIIKNDKLFLSLIRNEISVVTKSELPKDKRQFKGKYLSYLLECYENKLIDLTELNELRYCVMFDNSTWELDEIEITEYIINKLRLHLIKHNPKGIEYIENPTFDMLMTVNEVEYSHD